MNIRAATIQDRDDVQRIHLCAFPEGENTIVSKLAIDLLSEKTKPKKNKKGVRLDDYQVCVRTLKI